MNNPYRTLPPTYEVLDIACRRCGEHGLVYAYFPYVLPVPGPLCRQCCIEWSGQSGVRHATIGVGFSSYPMLGRDYGEHRKYVVPARKNIKVITMPGPRNYYARTSSWYFSMD